MWILFGCCLIPIIIFYRSYSAYTLLRRKYKDVDKLPGPPKKPIVGNALDFGYNNVAILKNIGNILEKYGRVIRIWIGPFSVKIFTTDPKYLEAILTSSEHIDKGERYFELEDAYGRGLFIEGGDVWKANRKMLAPAFHYRVLDQFAKSFHSVGQRLIKVLHSKCDTTFDIADVIKLYALDALCGTLMGVDVKSLEDGSGVKYIESLDSYLQIKMKRFFSVLMRYDFFFKYTSEYKQYQHAVAYIHKFCTDILSERSEQRKNEKLHENNGTTQKGLFIDLLLDSERLSFEEKRNEVQCMITAGFDTVSATMSFALYELAKHPEMQDRLLEEVDRTIGLEKDIVILSKHLDDMTFVDRFVKEAIRMYHPVPMIERVIAKDIELDGVKIPKGTEIAFQLFWLHWDKEFFPNPHVFDPDRFLDENMERANKFVYVPFSAGPRNCLGYKHALINAKVTILNILRHFELVALPNHTPILATAGVLQSHNGLPIQLKRRK